MKERKFVNKFAINRFATQQIIRHRVFAVQQRMECSAKKKRKKTPIGGMKKGVKRTESNMKKNMNKAGIG